MRIRGSVSGTEDLPLHAQAGDAYLTGDGKLWCYDGYWWMSVGEDDWVSYVLLYRGDIYSFRGPKQIGEIFEDINNVQEEEITFLNAVYPEIYKRFLEGKNFEY